MWRRSDDTPHSRATAQKSGGSHKTSGSSPGKKDGLYWAADPQGEAPSPGGPEIKDSKTPYADYYFKILTLKARRLREANTTTSLTVTRSAGLR